MTTTPPAAVEAGPSGFRLQFALETINHDITALAPPAEPALPHPITLRISFDPKLSTALFRFHAMVPLEPESEADTEVAHPFYLQLRPEHIRSLRFDNSSLHFHLRHGAMTLIGPAFIPVGDVKLKSGTLEGMALLSQYLAIAVRLPAARAAQHTEALMTLCKALSTTSKQIHTDHAQVNLRGLYRGQGGRVVALNEVLGDVGVDEVPPPYISPGSSTHKSKRQRTKSPSESDSGPLSSKKLSDGQGAHMLMGLLRQLDEKKQGIKALMDELDRKSARAAEQMKQMDEQARSLKELIATATATTPTATGVPRLENAVDVDSKLPEKQATRKSPSPSADSTASAASSTTSKVSARTRSYIETRLNKLRDEMREHIEDYVDSTTADHSTIEAMQTYVDNSLTDYATVAAMESLVNDELDGALSNHVETFEMYEAITEAVDNAVDELRTRVLQAWDV